MTKKKVDNISLESAYSELNGIVKEFENGNIDLEKSISKFKRGLELASFLKSKLKKMENEVEEIKAKFDDIDKEQPDLVKDQEELNF